MKLCKQLGLWKEALSEHGMFPIEGFPAIYLERTNTVGLIPHMFQQPHCQVMKHGETVA